MFWSGVTSFNQFPLRDASQGSSTASLDVELGELGLAAKPTAKMLDKLCQSWLCSFETRSNPGLQRHGKDLVATVWRKQTPKQQTESKEYTATIIIIIIESKDWIQWKCKQKLRGVQRFTILKMACADGCTLEEVGGEPNTAGKVRPQWAIAHRFQLTYVQGVISIVLRRGCYPGEMQPRGGARIFNMYGHILTWGDLGYVVRTHIHECVHMFYN